MWSATLLLVASVLVSAVAPTRLPDTSGIDFVLTDTLAVDQFFSLWLVFNNDDVRMSAEPFTIFAPRNNDHSLPQAQTLLAQPELVKKLLLDHIVLGVKLDLGLSSDFSVSTLGNRTVNIHRVNGTLYANGAEVLRPRVEVPNGILVVLDNYLFRDYDPETSRMPTTQKPQPASLVKITADNGRANVTEFLYRVNEVLAVFKSGVKVFHQFLSKSNVSRLLKPDEQYTVLIPTDTAFQRWHPIDWGFYPFSVPEFTEEIIVNHFVRGNLRQGNIANGQNVTTLGGRQIKFTKQGEHSLAANGIDILKGDTPVLGGNIMFLKGVLFVDDSIVQKLHEENKDKETAPLLAFPWIRSQFLSHAFFSLEGQPERFSHFLRLFNLEDLASYITGKGYTFFVPTNKAFEELGLGSVPDQFLSNKKGLHILLNHFVKGRFYNRDLVDGKQLHTLGDKTIHVRRAGDNITLNNAVVENSDIFVYNLGNMIFIDKVLFATKEDMPTVTLPPEDTTAVWTTEQSSDVESVPAELAEENGSLPDILLEETNSTESSDSPTNEPNLDTSSEDSTNHYLVNAQ